MSADQEPDAEAEAEAGNEWASAIREYTEQASEARWQAYVADSAVREAKAAVDGAQYDMLTEAEKEAMEAEYEAEGEREHQAYLEEQAEAELFDRLESEISEPEISEPEIGD